MDTKYTLHDIKFEWDRRKASVNVHKHGVSFELACEVFFDPFVSYLEDELVDGEIRETIIGMTTDWHLLCVIYVLRDNSIRIISARLATKSEREQYET